MSDAALHRLAARAGIAVHWHDWHGTPHTVGNDSLRALLRALDLPADSGAQVQASGQALEQALRQPGPLLTADAGAPCPLPECPPDRACRLLAEDGSAQDARTFLHAGSVVLQAPAAPGYYALQFATQQRTLAVAPAHCTSVADRCGSGARPWGIAAQLYSLAEPGDMGLASYATLARFAERAAAHGADALAVSPSHAMFSADPARRSPYGPSSRLFLNALHVDPVAACGETAVAQALVRLGSTTAARHLEAHALIDWPTAGSLRLALLRELHATLLDDAAARRDFEAFCVAGGEALQAHARFEMLHALLGGAGWQQWPDGFAAPDRPDVQRLAAQHADEVRFHLLLQWLARRQRDAAQQRACAAGMRIGLVADLAIGSDPGGSHAWARQQQMLRGVGVGAPPDPLAPGGQAWGIAAFSPMALQRSGYAAFIELLRANMACAGGLRIDHVMGLQRLWLIPPGAGSAEGAYLAYPLPDLLRLVALESWRHRCLVVGEDLGTVDAALRERLAARAALGMSVLYFERDRDAFVPPQRWRRASVAMTSTHDLPTVAGWWEGRDLELRAALAPPDPVQAADARAARSRDRAALWQAMLDSGAAAGAAPDPADPHSRARVADAALAQVGRAAAELALVPLEDVLATPDAPNLPGTVDEHPNWRRRLPSPTAAELGRDATARRLALLAAARTGA